MKKIAIIGTGIMGSGMADNFLKNGHQVFIWNRTKENTQNLLTKGAVFCTTPQEATFQADIIFEVTANDESSRMVWLGEEGILAGAAKDKILIASATLSIEWIDELVSLCNEKSFVFFDMPLTGGRIGAETGNLVLLAGGDEKILESIKPVLAAISSQVSYFGKSGQGIRFKLLLNMLQGIHANALAEVLSIAQKRGMDIQKVGEALSERPGGIVTKRVWEGYQEQPRPINFSVEWITKDLKYAKSFAEGIPVPLLDNTLEKYNEAIDKGLDQDDWTVIAKL